MWTWTDSGKSQEMWMDAVAVGGISQKVLGNVHTWNDNRRCREMWTWTVQREWKDAQREEEEFLESAHRCHHRLRCDLKVVPVHTTSLVE